MRIHEFACELFKKKFPGKEVWKGIGLVYLILTTKTNIPWLHAVMREAEEKGYGSKRKEYILNFIYQNNEWKDMGANFKGDI